MKLYEQCGMTVALGTMVWAGMALQSMINLSLKLTLSMTFIGIVFSYYIPIWIKYYIGDKE